MRRRRFRSSAVPELKYHDITIETWPRFNMRPLYRITFKGGTLDTREKLAKYILSELEKRRDEVELNDGCEVRPGYKNSTEIIRKELDDSKDSNHAHLVPLTNYHTYESIVPILKDIVNTLP